MCDKGDVVGRALQVPHQIDGNVGILRLALPLVEPFDMGGNEVTARPVDLVLEGVHFFKLGKVAEEEGGEGHHIQPFEAVVHALQHVEEILREDQPVAHIVLRIFGDVVGKLADTHDVVEHIVQRRYGALLLHHQRRGGQFDEIGYRGAVHLREHGVFAVHFRFYRYVLRKKGLKSGVHGVHGERESLARFLIEVPQSDRGGTQQAFVEVGKERRFGGLLFSLFLADEVLCDPHESLDEGQEQQRVDDVEQRVEGCDLQGAAKPRFPEHGDVRGENRGEHGIVEPPPADENDHEEDRAEEVEEKVDQGRPFCVRRSPKRGDERRDAGADVGADDDVERRIPAPADHDAERGHRDDDGVHRRRRLHERRNGNADEKEQEGIFDGGENSLYGIEFFRAAFKGQRPRHEFKPHKDKAERRNDVADRLRPLVLGEHGEKYAYRRKREEEHRDVRPRQGDDPGVQRGADIRAHDDGGRLEEGHDARIDKADHHDRRKGGTLAEDRHCRADPHPRKTALGRLVEHFLQLAVGDLRHVLGEDTHPHQKGADAAEDLHDDFYNGPCVHIFRSLSFAIKTARPCAKTTYTIIQNVPVLVHRIQYIEINKLNIGAVGADGSPLAPEKRADFVILIFVKIKCFYN